jgi:hypothetical protein
MQARLIAGPQLAPSPGAAAAGKAPTVAAQFRGVNVTARLVATVGCSAVHTPPPGGRHKLLACRTALQESPSAQESANEPESVEIAGGAPTAAAFTALGVDAALQVRHTVAALLHAWPSQM